MGIWSASALLVDGLLLGYYMEKYIGVETRTVQLGVRCQVLGVRWRNSGREIGKLERGERAGLRIDDGRLAINERRPLLRRVDS